MGYELTKSRYCKGLQCRKILWMDQHHPELGEDVTSQSVLDNGTKVGELARSYFGEYELVSFNVNKAEMADKTRELMRSVDNIAEASFFYDYLFCAVDILHRNGDGRLKSMMKYVSQSQEPEKDIDLCCDKPYPCAYRKYCGRHVPEYSVFNLARMQAKKKYELYHEGVVSYQDILSSGAKINANQKRQVESVLYDKPDEYDVEEIKKFLETLSYPIYHLDFETFQQAVPEFVGCRPYEQIPFQYSLHVEYEDGRLEHFEFLAKEGEDPRRALAEQLIKDIPVGVCATAYNMSFKKTVLKHLAEEFPDLSAHLMDIHDNMHDLMIPFQKQYYYSKAMQGSYSIKYVLPALWPGDPELDYHNLEGVHNGSEASASFADMVNHTPEEIAEMRDNLLKYCGLDTYAMVKVLKKLKEIAGKD